MSVAVSFTGASVVTTDSEQIDSAVERTAVRFVRAWGFSTVGMVAEKFRLIAKAPAPRVALARRVLARLPDLEWLDPTREWFTLLDRESSMRAAVEKIVAVVGIVEGHELEEALGKRHSFGDAPPAVVRAYVETLATRVARRGPFDWTLTSEELIVLEAFEQAGSSLGLAELRAATRASVPEASLTHVLRSSPLFVRASRGRYRVVGSLPLARYVTLAGSTTIVAPAQ
jgi:hypothetical protein